MMPGVGIPSTRSQPKQIAAPPARPAAARPCDVGPPHFAAQLTFPRGRDILVAVAPPPGAQIPTRNAARYSPRRMGQEGTTSAPVLPDPLRAIPAGAKADQERVATVYRGESAERARIDAAGLRQAASVASQAKETSPAEGHHPQRALTGAAALA